MQFEAGDIVVVAGFTESSCTNTVNNVLCEVVECGKHDVFLKKLDSIFPNVFAYPINRCQKVLLKNPCGDATVTQPKLGNLVLSMYTTMSKVEKFVGVLVKIIDKPGSKKSGVVRVASKDSVVPFDSIIILEE